MFYDGRFFIADDIEYNLTWLLEEWKGGGKNSSTDNEQKRVTSVGERERTITVEEEEEWKNRKIMSGGEEEWKMGSQTQRKKLSW